MTTSGNIGRYVNGNTNNAIKKLGLLIRWVNCNMRKTKATITTTVFNQFGFKDFSIAFIN